METKQNLTDTQLAQKAINIGNFNGKKLQELINVLGKPSKIDPCRTEFGGPGKLVFFEDKYFLLAIVVDDNDICIGINKEVAKNVPNSANIITSISFIASIFMILFGLYVLFIR